MKAVEAQRALYRILIVDDDAAIRDLLAELLEAPNRSIEVRDTAQAALEFLQHNPVDLAFVDFMLPGMRGSELAAAIKKRRPQTHVVICTGYLAEATAEGAQLTGVDRLLQKPLDLGEVMQIADSYAKE
jgi:CheY-like chemotaxis protein